MRCVCVCLSGAAITHQETEKWTLKSVRQGKLQNQNPTSCLTIKCG